MTKQQLKTNTFYLVLLAGALASVMVAFRATNSGAPQEKITPKAGMHISLIGGNLGSRMSYHDYFETELHLRHPDKNLLVRNMCDGGDTPGFRPHAARFSPWAFAGAEAFYTELANNSESEGFNETPDQWLTKHQTEVLITFFGFSESFGGAAGLQNYKAELQAFIDHTRAQKYDGTAAPQLVMVSPIAYEDLSAKLDVPNGKQANANLLLYTNATKEIAAKNKVMFVNAFGASQKWYETQAEDLTIDGIQLNEKGYQLLGTFLADEIFGKQARVSPHAQLVYEAVLAKNLMWLNDFKIPNGVHVYGRRYNPFGPDNYPAEIAKIRQMTTIRDKAIGRAAQQGQATDYAEEDKNTLALPEVKTNFNAEKNRTPRYLYGQEAVDSIQVAQGYKLELFASEQEFPDLANPAQMTFDNQGRLWVATMPSYPHYKPGDPQPNDKLLILEDTNNDGKADKQTIFADHLHLPVGFEITHQGVLVSQGSNLVLLKDTNGDDKADAREILLSGFDDHDTHHAISAFVADESGAVMMGEGIFLHTNVETPYGTVRATNGGFYRYNLTRRHLERTAQLAIPNPWGIAFDEWGQCFFAETSGPDVRWLTPSTGLPRYGYSNPKTKALIEESHRVRPTSGLEFVHSRHFPEEVQGDMLINNTIGFLGLKQHRLFEDGTGYDSRHRLDLFKSSDRNFRPVDMEFAPDGSLYIIDWHNVLIGHMQHNARDPLRDHVHGRVYRVTYPARPLVTPAKVAGARIGELLANLKLPEYRTRYRTKRELRGRNQAEVLAQLRAWILQLDKNDPRHGHHLLEALWVSWGANKVEQPLLKTLLQAKDHRVRAAAVHVLRYMYHQVPDYLPLLLAAAKDPHGRVRMEAIVAASRLGKTQGNQILAMAKTMPLDEWMKDNFEACLAHLNGKNLNRPKEVHSTTWVKGKDLELFTLGRTLFAKDGYCMTCHQADGRGLPASGFPPLAGTPWVTGDPERLIKIVLKGLMGPMEVNKQKYEGNVPMTPYANLLTDREIAGVLTYVRNAFGNEAPAIYPGQVKAVREKTAAQKNFYTPKELLEMHPMEQ